MTLDSCLGAGHNPYAHAAVGACLSADTPCAHVTLRLLPLGWALPSAHEALGLSPLGWGQVVLGSWLQAQGEWVGRQDP